MRQGSIDSAKIGDDPALYAVTCKSKGPNGGQAARSFIARPGGNITGIPIVAGAEIYGKNLELLKAVLPGRARIATLFNTTSSVNALWLKATEEAAGKLGVRLVPTGVRSSEDFEQAFALMSKPRRQVLSSSVSRSSLAPTADGSTI